MGYYTNYELATSDGEVMSHIEGISIESGYGNPFDDDCKWYEHEEHMREYSKKHPSVRFTLEGEGEESGDIWVKYFKGGLMQECKARIEFDPFDESKLA